MFITMNPNKPEIKVGNEVNIGFMRMTYKGVEKKYGKKYHVFQYGEYIMNLSNKYFKLKNLWEQ